MKEQLSYAIEKNHNRSLYIIHSSDFKLLYDTFHFDIFMKIFHIQVVPEFRVHIWRGGREHR